MIAFDIEGFKKNLVIEHLLLDFNGTLAIDGKLLTGVEEILIHLAQKVTIHILTGNTFGTAESELKNVACKLIALPTEHLGEEKYKYLQSLDSQSVISIGNGRNDRLMLESSAIGILVIQQEGASAETLLAADVVCPDIFSALTLLTNPLRLIATLRN